MWIISRGTKCVRAHVRKHDNDILVFQKTLLAVVRSLIVQRRIESLVLTLLTRRDATRRDAMRCVHVRAHTRLHVHCVNISLSAATSSGVRLIYCRHTRHIAIREIWPGKDRAYKLYARVGCMCESRTCVCAYIYIYIYIYICR